MISQSSWRCSVMPDTTNVHSYIDLCFACGAILCKLVSKLVSIRHHLLVLDGVECMHLTEGDVIGGPSIYKGCSRLDCVEHHTYVSWLQKEISNSVKEGRARRVLRSDVDHQSGRTFTKKGPAGVKNVCLPCKDLVHGYNEFRTFIYEALWFWMEGTIAADFIVRRLSSSSMRHGPGHITCHLACLHSNSCRQAKGHIYFKNIYM